MEDFKKVKDFIEGLKDEAIRIEELLTSIPAMAPESDGDGEEKKAIALEKYLISLGFPTPEYFYAPDERVSSKRRPNMLFTIPGKQKTSLWIISHLDVVPPGEGWDASPWKVRQEGDKIIGRGVEDDQQGLTSSILAALPFIKLNMTPEYTIKLLFVADEEVGSKYGVCYLLKEHSLFQKGDLILVPDGGDPNGETIEVAEKTTIWFKFTTHGLQTHASMPDSGNNAFVAGSDLVLRMHNLQNIFNKKDPLFAPDYSTFQPTKKEANVPNVNTIPGEDVFYVDARILPLYDPEEIVKAVKKECKEVEEKYGVKIDIEYDDIEYSPQTPKDAKIVKELGDALRKVRGLEPKIIGIGGGTVAAPLRVKGFDVAMWSTLDDMAHQPNEYALVSNIVDDAVIMASVAYGVENI
ncbi:MAG: M20 family metallo-hydrolase [Treponema sp.]